MLKTAVVILNWNGCDMLRQFLPSVIRYTGTKDAAVYVADNGSTDESVVMVGTEFPSVRLIQLGQNYGFAEGYNRALKEVEATYVVLLNSDVEVTEGWLDTLVDYMDNHPETAACQPKIRDWKNKEMFEYAGAAGGFIDKYGYPFCRGRIMSVVEKDCGQYDDVITVFWATGAALCIRKEVYNRVGGLDGRFFAHMEEIDLCWRLHARGFSVVCVPQSIVYHVGGATLKKENPRKTFLNFRNNLVMLYKNLPEDELNSVMRVRTCLDYLAALMYLLKGQAPAAKAVVNARKEYKQIKADFRKDRENNLKESVAHFIPGRTKNSILVQHFIKRRKYFSQLHNH